MVALSAVELKRAAEYELQTVRPRLSFLQPTRFQQGSALTGRTSFCPSGLFNEAYKVTVKVAVRVLSLSGKPEFASGRAVLKRISFSH
jgi:hypothetical protein